ncbi:MAG TPA: RNA polymerase sigma factor [Gemmatimonadaceae bacterium]|jgi:RNA polymerase sigma-70 factor (ECF subfamily)
MNDIIPDDELITRARAGDDRAFALLVDRYESVVAATVVGMLGSGEDADDVGQETFIRFHRALHDFRGDSSLKTYLVHIAMNLSLNALKRRRRSLLRFVRGDETVNEIAEIRPGPDDRVESRETRERVRRAVLQLAEHHRAVVVLRMFNGYSTKEVAESLGIAEGTVMSRLSRAMKELEKKLS